MIGRSNALEKHKMFVVRVVEDKEPDFKVFGELRKARSHWGRAALKVMDDELMSSALFDVPAASDPYDAVEAVKFGDKARVELLELEECPDTRRRKMIENLNLEIEL